MDYLRFSLLLRSHKLYVFSLEDIKNLFPREKSKTIKNNLIRWLSKGYLARLKRNLYKLVEQGSELKIPDLYIANRLYEPSYISLETALSIYSIIPDIASGVTSIATMPTRTFRNKYGSFLYRSCQKTAFTGYRLMLYEGFKVYIADKEKALVDFLYFRLRSGYSLDFSEERLNKKILSRMNWRKAFKYAKLFNKKTVNTLKLCKEYVK